MPSPKSPELLLEREDEDAALGPVARHALTLSRASASLVAIVGNEGELEVHAADARAEDWAGPVDGAARFVAPMWTDVRSAKQPILLAPATAADTTPWRQEVSAAMGSAGSGPTAVLPLPPGQGDAGVLVVSLGRGGRRTASRVDAVADRLRATGRLALIAGRAQRDRASWRCWTTGDRIARDMHDHVIQRLFATGLSCSPPAGCPHIPRSSRDRGRRRRH